MQSCAGLPRWLSTSHTTRLARPCCLPQAALECLSFADYSLAIKAGRGGMAAGGNRGWAVSCELHVCCFSGHATHPYSGWDRPTLFPP